jgi:hypothetical protein
VDANELDNSKRVGAASENNLSPQFLGFRHLPSPINRFDVEALALKNHLPTLRASVEML